VADLLYFALFLASIIFFINRVLFREHLQIPRLSPTLAIPGSFRVSRSIDLFSIKEISHTCFPGDHATTALTFALCYIHLAGWRLGKWALGYAILLTLPRLILGAHWLSDILVGSLSITLLCFAWAYATPLRSMATRAMLGKRKTQIA
jgi:membrane-associated phospholipid phosphatase